MFALQAWKIWFSVPCKNSGHSSTYIHTNIRTTVSCRRDGDRRFPGAHWQTNLSSFMSARFSDTVSKEVSGFLRKVSEIVFYTMVISMIVVLHPYSNRTDLFSRGPHCLVFICTMAAITYSSCRVLHNMNHLKDSLL